MAGMTKQEIALSIKIEEEQVEQYRTEIRQREAWITAAEASLAQLKVARDKAPGG